MDDSELAVDFFEILRQEIEAEINAEIIELLKPIKMDIWLK